MNGEPQSDDDLVRQLPLPLAQLYRRAHNAKTPLDRHLAAYYLWEAALKLLGATAIATYAERGVHSPDVDERLQNLARPALGHWWEFVRLLVPLLAESDDAGFRAARDLLLGRARDDLPRAAGLDAALREALESGSGARVTVRLAELFDRLVRYRNREFGHGATGHQPSAFYDRMGRALLLGIAEVLGRLDVLAGRRLVAVTDVRRLSSGGWLVERYALEGEAPRRLESLECHEGDAPRLRLYLTPSTAGDRPNAWLSLHPLAVYDPDGAEVLFLNARRGRRRVEYLGYHSGRTLERADLDADQCALLTRLLGIEVDAACVDQWAARSQAEEPPPDPVAAPAPRRLGEFELLSELGRGGMGIVYRAWQPSLGRQVALKCMLRAGDPKADARFNREIHALGRVEHPHLVKVFTSAADGDQWFYAMELVEGATLGAVCGQLHGRGSAASEVDLPTWQATLSTACQEARAAERPLSAPGDSRPPSRPAPAGVVADTRSGSSDYVRHVVALVRQVAEAAHALHEAGVIHRDIKPDNILVTPDGAQAVLMDLGLAQLADEAEGRLTRTRQFVGTLRYASPEQVLSVPLDRRSDVYSLGATLWELLTLRPLFGATEQMPTPELMLKVQSADPDAPRRLNPRVPEDLQAIVLKCLEKDRSRRYATAAELADDLARWLRGEPVQAQPPTLRYLLGKALRRHRGRVALAASLLAVVVMGTVAGLLAWGLFRIDQSRNRAVIAEKAAVKAGREAVIARDQETDSRREAERLKEVLRQRLVEQVDAANAFKCMADGDPATALVWFADALKLESDAGKTARADINQWRLAWAFKSCPKLNQVFFHGSEVLRAAFSPDSRRVLTADNDHTARIWDAASGATIAALEHQDRLNQVLFSPDGRRVVTTSADQTARLWDASSGAPIATLEHAGEVFDAAFSPDGRRVVTASRDQTARVWDAETGDALVTHMHEEPVSRAAFSPDGRRIVTASGAAAEVWDSAGGGVTVVLDHSDRVDHAAFGPGGRRVVTASRDQTARVWDAESGAALASFQHEREVRYASFSPDGLRVLTASDEPTARVWDVKSGAALASFTHERELLYASFSPDGRHVLTASDDHTARLWNADNGAMLALLKHEDGVHHAEFSADGRRVLTASADRTARIWDVANGPMLGRLEHKSSVSHAAFSPEGRRVLTASRDFQVRVWDAESGATIVTLKHEASVNDCSFNPDGRRVLTASDDTTARAWDAASGAAIATFKHDEAVFHAEFSPDGQRALTTSADHTARVWDVASGTRVASFTHEHAVLHAQFSRDGRRVLTTGADGTARVWDIAIRATVASFEHDDAMSHAVFSPDGRRILTASDDHTARVWNAANGAIVASFEHKSKVYDAEFSPDGRRVVTTSADNTVRVWDIASGAVVATLENKAPVEHAEFSPDGGRLFTTGMGAARVWDGLTGALLVSVEHEHGRFAAAFSPDGRRVIIPSDEQIPQVWQFDPISSDLHTWTALAQLLSARRIEPAGELVPLTPNAFHDSWVSLRARNPELFVTLPLEILAWHAREAAGCEEQGAWSFAIQHLDYLIDARPDLASLFARRGEARAHLARWRDAVADDSQAIALQPDDPAPRIARATAFAELGDWKAAESDLAPVGDLVPLVKLAQSDLPAYRHACAALIAEFGGRFTAAVAERIAWACVLAPDAVNDRNEVLRLAELAVAGEEDPRTRLRFLQTLGAANYRAGEFDQAVRYLNERIPALRKTTNGGFFLSADTQFGGKLADDPAANAAGNPLDWLFLAMAHHRLKHTDEARRWLDMAVAWIDASTPEKPKDDRLGVRLDWQTRLALRVLRHEAESLIRSNPERP